MCVVLIADNADLDLLAARYVRRQLTRHRLLKAIREQEQIVVTGTVCGNCGTENEHGKDFCSECGKPLTRAAEQGARGHNEAQDTSVIPGSDPSGPISAAPSTAPEHEEHSTEG